MSGLQPTDVLVPVTGAQVVDLPDGRLLVRHRGGLSLLAGVRRHEVDALVGLVDGARTVAEVVAGARDGARARQLLEALSGEVVRRRRDPPPARAREDSAPRGPADARAPAGRLAVLVSGPGGEALAERLRGVVPFELSVHRTVPAPGPGGSLQELPRGLPAAGLVLAALEDVPYRRLFVLQAALLQRGLPVLFVTADPDGVRVGPTVLAGGATPCLGCSLGAALAPAGLAPAAALEAGGALVAASLSGADMPDPAAVVARELVTLGGRPGEGPVPATLTGVLLLARTGGVRSLPVPRHPHCPVCGGREEGPAEGAPAGGDRVPARWGAWRARAERARARIYEGGPARALPAGDDPPGVDVGVLGGGTAGFLAALAFRARRPADRVTVIRTRDVPVIGVGEATTPLVPQFLHVDLGVGAAELFREVRPTFKLGIRFTWGAPGPAGGFPYPFGAVRTLEAAAWDGDLDACSLQAALMAAGALPVAAGADGRLTADFGTAVAYHLDNRRLAAFLERLAVARGVEVVEARIVGVERREGEDGEPEVSALAAEDGRRFAFDLYLDCSGFRSLLLGDALGSPFVGYEGSLFTDRALVGEARHDGRLPPWTGARTLEAGWCWSIPQEDADHVGYVFASRLLDADGAAAELRTLRPGLDAAGLREVRFRAGRRRHFWKGNVVALGNAYGFVEPLESTSLHLLIRQVGMLLRALPPRLDGRGWCAARAVRPLLDRRTGAFWDYVRWFLAIHFRFNRRLDTPFWRLCREETDVSAHAELLELYRERGPLAYDPAARSLFDYPDPLWGASGVDTILLGQGVPCRLPAPAGPREAWREQTRLYGAIAGRALRQEEVLRRLPDHPEVLESLERGFRAHGAAF